MGKRKYPTTLMVVEHDTFFRNEILRTLQKAFKRKVQVKTAPSLSWAMNMETVPDILIVDVVSDKSEEQIIQGVSSDLWQYILKYPLVEIGLMGFLSKQIISELKKTAPSLDQVEALSGPCLRVAMQEFVLKHVKGGTAC